MHIKIDHLSSPEIRELLEEHLASMRRHSPPESVHTLPIEELRKPEITFWTVWEDGELLGGGALNEFVPFLWRDGAAPLAPQASLAQTQNGKPADLTSRSPRFSFVGYWFWRPVW